MPNIKLEMSSLSKYSRRVFAPILLTIFVASPAKFSPAHNSTRAQVISVVLSKSYLMY